ncbi:MAG: restriction endonuclease [Clostridia bacterium]|nr:restriction endonuclease [Clostridia bacterium]
MAKKGGNINSVALLIGFICICGILSNPAVLGTLLVIIVAVIAIVVFRKQKLQKEEQLRYVEYMKCEQTIGSLIAQFHERPTDFEEYVAELFRFYGYDAQVTAASNDGGKDIIMHKDGCTYVVEVKLYATHNKISREKIQKLHSAMIDCNADYSWFVTTSDFASTAVEYAERNGVYLINGEILVSMIEERRQAFLNQ